MLSQWNSTSHVQTARFHKSALHTINRWYHMAAYADTGTVFARFLKFLILCGVYVSPAIVGEALFLVAYVSARRLTLAAYSAAGNVQTVHHCPQMPTRSSSTIPVRTVYTSLHQRCTSFSAFSNICSCQGRQRQHTDLAVSPSTGLVSGISYLRLYVYHRHLDSFKAS